jgi:multidrug efflux pump subunit AcrB
MLRYPKALRIEASDIDDVLIKTPAGHFVPLQQVATYHYESAVSQIQRVNGVNAIHVSAYVNDTLVSPEQVQQAVMTFFDTQIKTQYPHVAVKLSGNALEAQKTMLQMYGLFFVVTVLIYGALAIPLRSYFKPLIILLVIPLSFFGALVGHIVLDINVSLLSFMGCMALSGVVVNDSLVLMHQIYQTPNPTRAEIIRACASRFRPIFINSFTTFLGLVPLLIESNPQSQFIVPMAVSLSFGVLLSSMITLVLIPLLVSMKFNFKFNLYRTA